MNYITWLQIIWKQEPTSTLLPFQLFHSLQHPEPAGGQHFICTGLLFPQGLGQWLVYSRTTVTWYNAYSHHRPGKDCHSGCGMHYRSLCHPWSRIWWVHFKFWPEGANVEVYTLFRIERATWWFLGTVADEAGQINYYFRVESPSVSPRLRAGNSNGMWRITDPLPRKKSLEKRPVV